jgi:hypothetical protein
VQRATFKVPSSRQEICCVGSLWFFNLELQILNFEQAMANMSRRACDAV